MGALASEGGGGAPRHFRFAIDEVRPPVADVETVLGYGDGRSPVPVRQAIDEVLAAPESLWSIEGGFVQYDRARVDARDHCLVVEGVSLEVGKIVASHLDGSSAVAVFLCTAGPGIEGLSRSLMSSRDTLAGYVADMVGSLVVERAMDRVQGQLEARVQAAGLRTTNGYSPGHCGWNVAEQQKLFRLLPSGFCGVQLTESCLMHPLKSVSGLIGLGAAVDRQPSTCKLCDMDRCPYRRLKGPDAAA